MKHNSDTIKKYKNKMSFTDWVLEQQEMLEEQILDQVPGYLASPGADQATKHHFCLNVLKLTETEYLEALNKATNGGVVASVWN